MSGDIYAREGTVDPKDLVKVWSAPDNTRLTPKQISIRLPLHVAAKINAISEMFPAKTKTQLIGDLLAASLSEFAEGLSKEPLEEEAGANPLYDECGTRGLYERLVRKHLEELEREVEGG
jgi:hypothetical protein